MIETDVLYAHVKKQDWLRPVAEKFLRRVVRGEFGNVLTSREVLHELYHVSMEEGLTMDSYIARIAALTAIPNLTYLDTTFEIDLLAATVHEAVQSRINFRRLLCGYGAQYCA